MADAIAVQAAAAEMKNQQDLLDLSKNIASQSSLGLGAGRQGTNVHGSILVEGMS